VDHGPDRPISENWAGIDTKGGSMSLGLLILRLAIGLLFVGHGAQKLFGAFGGHGPAGTGAFFESLGLRPGYQMAVAAGVSEIGGGLMVALGLLTPVGAAILITVMVTAILTAHQGSGLWVTEGGIEYNLVLIAGLFAVAAAGAGQYSFDNALGLDVAGAVWALAALGAGVLGGIGTVLAGRVGVAQRRGGGPAHPAAG
jgi:putative oxidoreductase